MNEIEKLYENASIAPELLLDAKTKEEVLRRYPPFTAEKQINLIKWLAKYKYSYGLQYLSDKWTNCCDFCWESFEYASEDTDFEESLSGLINIIWQSLTDTEKEQIKEILND